MFFITKNHYEAHPLERNFTTSSSNQDYNYFPQESNQRAPEEMNQKIRYNYKPHSSLCEAGEI